MAFRLILARHEVQAGTAGLVGKASRLTLRSADRRSRDVEYLDVTLYDEGHQMKLASMAAQESE